MTALKFLLGHLMLALGLIGLNEADKGYDIMVRHVWLYIKSKMRLGFYGSPKSESILVWHFDSSTSYYTLLLLSLCVIHSFNHDFGDFSFFQESFCWNKMNMFPRKIWYEQIQDNRLPSTDTQPKMLHILNAVQEQNSSFQ